MNRKGFTLIEVLAVVFLIGLIGVLIVPGLLTNIDTAKETAYKTLVKSIVTSSKTYYEECEFGDLSDESKYGTYACEIKPGSETETEKTNYITTSLSTLANTGFLKINNTNNLGQKVVLNPINNNDISSCQIKITKKVNKSTFKVTYQIDKIGTDTNCPDSYN